MGPAALIPAGANETQKEQKLDSVFQIRSDVLNFGEGALCGAAKVNQRRESRMGSSDLRR